MSEKEHGTIKWYKHAKGYGFITPANGGPDVLLHASVVERLGFKPADGLSVTFEAKETQKGRQAVWVG
jgi:cold shock CspA family protein